MDLEEFKTGSAAFLACDVNADGRVGADDARSILRASVALEDPVGWEALHEAQACVHVIYSDDSGEGASTENLLIYIPSYGRYVAYRFVHTVSDAVHADVWRIHRCSTASADYALGIDITKTGEWECALRLTGRGRFCGGQLQPYFSRRE